MVLPGQFNTIFIGFRVKQPWVSLEVQPFGKKKIMHEGKKRFSISISQPKCGENFLEELHAVYPEWKIPGSLNSLRY